MHNFGYLAQPAFPLAWVLVPAFGIGSLWMTVAFLAFANLGLAVMGFRAASASARERITIGLAGGMFLGGALAGHVYQRFATGGVLVNDLLIPAVVIILAVRSRRLAAATSRPAGRLAI